MTKKQFWQNASNRGLVTGAALFIVNLIGWAFKLEMNSPWLYELLLFVVIFTLIFHTGRSNARFAGPTGYGYSRAVGFVFAMMMFAGIVYGVGQFLMTNLIAREYYDALNAGKLDKALAMYRDTPMYDQILSVQGRVVRALSNPFVLIFGSVVNFMIKGGFLGLILCAFITRKPDLFATCAAPVAEPEHKEDDESGSE